MPACLVSCVVLQLLLLYAPAQLHEPLSITCTGSIWSPFNPGLTQTERHPLRVCICWFSVSNAIGRDKGFQCSKISCATGLVSVRKLLGYTC